MDFTRFLGTARIISLKGQEFKVRPLTINDFAEFHQYIKEKDTRAIVDATKHLLNESPPSDITDIKEIRIWKEERYNSVMKMIRDAASTYIPESRVNNEMLTLHGARFLIYQAMKKEIPTLKLDDMQYFIDVHNLKEAMNVLDVMISLDSTVGAENPMIETNQNS